MCVCIYMGACIQDLSKFFPPLRVCCVCVGYVCVCVVGGDEYVHMYANTYIQDGLN